MAVSLLRNTRLWVSSVTTGFTDANTKEILIGDDLSFSQGASETDITISEAGATPTRGSKRFIDAINPVEWSFSNYITPLADTLTPFTVSTPDYLLWHSLSTGSAPNLTVNDGGVYQNASNEVVNFTDSSYHELYKLNIYMYVDGVWYAITGAQVDTAEVSVDIADITKVTWSGFGISLAPLGAQPFDPVVIGISDAEFLAYQNSYIKNKLTILDIKDNADSVTYNNVAVTGATITISNNISYVTPSTLSRVDRPIGSFTGTLDISGSLQCYLDTKAGGSSALWQKIVGYTGSSNSFEFGLSIGGKYATASPGMLFKMPKVQVSVPELQSADVLGLNINFKAQGSTLSSGDGLVIAMSSNFTSTTIGKFFQWGDAAHA
jgi:hypothetical protein